MSDEDKKRLQTIEEDDARQSDYPDQVYDPSKAKYLPNSLEYYKAHPTREDDESAGTWVRATGGADVDPGMARAPDFIGDKMPAELEGFTTHPLEPMPRTEAYQQQLKQYAAKYQAQHPIGLDVGHAQLAPQVGLDIGKAQVTPQIGLDIGPVQVGQRMKQQYMQPGGPPQIPPDHVNALASQILMAPVATYLASNPHPANIPKHLQPQPDHSTDLIGRYTLPADKKHLVQGPHGWEMRPVNEPVIHYPHAASAGPRGSYTYEPGRTTQIRPGVTESTSGTYTQD